jgi:hypothetical protein
MAALDTAQFEAQAVGTARRNLPYCHDARQAAREALAEAHSSLSQQAFFACLDALGGPQVVLDRIERALKEPQA